MPAPENLEFLPTVITKFKIRSNSIVFYPSFELFNTNRGQNKASRDNLENNRVRGYLSTKSAGRVRDMVENWVNCNRAYQLQEKVRIETLLTFVTLTLPAKQKHDDKTLKRKALNYFLIYARRNWKIKNFIWKAEPQKNGNIHFHIIFDRFIDWEKVRSKWIEILDPLGYIDEFFKKHSHRDPNCTDIHSLYRDSEGNKITFAGAYLAKYMSKTNTGKHVLDRPIEGRIWGCSDNLKNLECFTGFDDYQTDKFFETLKNNSKLREFNGEYFRVFCGNWFSVSGENKELMKKIHSFYLEQFKKINDFTENE